MDFHSNNKVLITGINGFTGKYLKKYLEELNYEVYGLSNTIDEKKDKIFSCDINNQDELNLIIKNLQPNYIFHLAAISNVQHSDLVEMYKVNVIGTQNVLNASLKVKKYLKKIILASSATVYGNQTEKVLHENLVPNPINHYGISKLAMEQIAKTYFDELPILITRPFNYTAPGHSEHFVVPKIAKAFINNEKTIELGNIEVYREYNSIDYVLRVYFELMNSKSTGEIVNIASGKTHSLKEIISIFSKLSGHLIDIKINPQFVRKNEIITLAGDIVKLKKIIKIPKDNNIENVVNQFLNTNY
ncbi:GDP-mannose 4,6-dehydratase [Flavobacterium capsici]|uniref:GDP-mannose 4,6-dehydratase n=1 Tax=Flavobacterium capsici TaxID=3075618 RepID=A0AA96EWH3_9FLAO|nr:MULTISPECIES: GDP-mannose 4,6-dehydratase [unclassified Flavobacterium]WNM19674.1 GDP-mannose 4,6-dehydratase [Flavobacterium sp. PMR2A8]WNM21063.1 GDP-mannose 4,6-dehydratase [Flavobacterium sp. PMTSA4]